MAGSGSGSGYLDPHRVYDLVIRRMPARLFDYLDSVPGPSRDMHWQGIKLVANALRNLLSQGPRFCAPQIPSNFTSDAELTHSAASSSRTPAANPLQEKNYDVHRHAAMHDPSSSSSLKIVGPMLPPLQASTIINFPTRRAGVGDETSASNSGTHASAYIPSRDNSMIAPERRGGAPLLRKTKSQPSRAATSSPQRTPVRLRRRTLPLRDCQRRILSVPEPEPEPETQRVVNSDQGISAIQAEALRRWSDDEE